MRTVAQNISCHSWVLVENSKSSSSSLELCKTGNKCLNNSSSYLPLRQGREYMRVEVGGSGDDETFFTASHDCSRRSENHRELITGPSLTEGGWPRQQASSSSTCCSSGRPPSTEPQLAVLGPAADSCTLDLCTICTACAALWQVAAVARLRVRPLCNSTDCQKQARNLSSFGQVIDKSPTSKL